MNAESSHQTKSLVRLTMACNERCPFCNVPAEDYPTRPTPWDELDRQLDEMVAQGQQTLTISGGEPTLLRRRLLELLEKGRARGLPLAELQTNAILIDDDYALALKRAGLTSAFVSLLSHQSHLHDRLAGLDGAFERCLTGIDALLDAGVRVALNPVTAHDTQALVPDYVAFVAARLPRVRSISLSAVQPHGRAKDAPELLPDYGVLRPAVERARAIAEQSEIELLNPYCGLPLCVGWQGDLSRSVEAIEALAPTQAVGVQNSGDKRHGAPCLDCALRTRCGGAWHAYWEHRHGAGLAAPVVRLDPLGDALVAGASGHALERAAEGGVEGALRRLDATTAPTRWLVVRELRSSDLSPLTRSSCTDLAIRTTAPGKETLSALRQLQRAQEGAQDQRRIRVSVQLDARRVSGGHLLQLTQLLSALYVDAIWLVGAPGNVSEALDRGVQARVRSVPD